jgi:hypothetical protein
MCHKSPVDGRKFSPPPAWTAGIKPYTKGIRNEFLSDDHVLRLSIKNFGAESSESIGKNPGREAVCRLCGLGTAGKIHPLELGHAAA